MTSSGENGFCRPNITEGFGHFKSTISESITYYIIIVPTINLVPHKFAKEREVTSFNGSTDLKTEQEKNR